MKFGDSSMRGWAEGQTGIGDGPGSVAVRSETQGGVPPPLSLGCEKWDKQERKGLNTSIEVGAGNWIRVQRGLCSWTLYNMMIRYFNWMPTLFQSYRKTLMLWTQKVLKLCAISLRYLSTRWPQRRVSLWYWFQCHCSELYNNPAINPTFMKVRVFSFCRNCFRELLIQLYGHFGGCSLWCCWIILHYTVFLLRCPAHSCQLSVFLLRVYQLRSCQYESTLHYRSDITFSPRWWTIILIVKLRRTDSIQGTSFEKVERVRHVHIIQNSCLILT